MSKQIIDSFCMLPTKEYLKQLVTLPPQKKGYLKLFGQRIATFLGITEEFQHVSTKYSLEELNKWMVEKIHPLVMELDQFVELLDNWNLEKCILMNENSETNTGIKSLSNDYFADIVHKYPDKFIIFAGVDPHKGEASVNELKRCITNLSLHGCNFTPFMDNLHANDHHYFPLYEICQEYTIPVWIHTSMNFSSRHSDFGHPKYLEDIAIRFPDLKIIAGHGGWPWVLELISLARKYPNIYIDTSTQRPRNMEKQGSGWEPLLFYGNNLLQDQVLFGSAWLLLGLPVDQIAEEVLSLPLKEKTKDKWLYLNAKKLFNI